MVRRLLWFSSAARRFVVAALLVRWLDEWWSYMPAGIIEDLRVDLGVSYTQSGWLLAIAYGGGILGGPLGVLADHVDRRAMAVVGSAIQTAGLILFATGSSFPVLAVAVFALGAASDLVIRPLEAGLADDAADGSRDGGDGGGGHGDGHDDGGLDRLLGRQHLLAFVGDFVGPLLLAIGAATALGWRGAFGLTAGALGLFTVLLAMSEFPPPEQPEAGARGMATEFVRIARRPDVVRLAALEMLLLPLDEPILGFAVARLVSDGSHASAQVLAAGYVVGGIAGSVSIDRRGVSPLTASLGPWFLLAGAVGTASMRNTVGGTLSMVLVGVGMAVVWTMLHERQLTVVADRSATVSSAVSTLAVLGIVIPASIGWVADQASLTGALWLLVGVAAALMVVIRSAVPARVSGPSHCVEAE